MTSIKEMLEHIEGQRNEINRGVNAVRSLWDNGANLNSAALAREVAAAKAACTKPRCPVCHDFDGSTREASETNP